MNICLFCGTFNPVHNAHLRMAEHVLRKFGFEKIIFIPSYIPPHKCADDAQHRLKMVELAISGRKGFEVSDIEFSLGETSYTYLTVLELQKRLGTSEKFNFIIGTDAFEKIESWYEADKLKDLLHFIVSRREDDCNLARFDYLREKGYDFDFTNLAFYDISSTELREKIACGESVSGLVPQKVEDYIIENGLYRRH
ncbi:MAG: nicotinate (nicotinamide) nucleotide adenylyltransferase [Fusobacterium sp.]|nr:nicotinate (nicotinamide) nucleotide adenylyltransferase [Fusobacterium sp.]